MTNVNAGLTGYVWPVSGSIAAPSSRRRPGSSRRFSGFRPSPERRARGFAAFRRRGPHV